MIVLPSGGNQLIAQTGRDSVFVVKRMLITSLCFGIDVIAQPDASPHGVVRISFHKRGDGRMAFTGNEQVFRIVIVIDSQHGVEIEF